MKPIETNLALVDLKVSPGVDSSLETLMTYVSDYEIKTHVHENLTKETKCICIDSRLENGLVCLC